MERGFARLTILLALLTAAAAPAQLPVSATWSCTDPGAGGSGQSAVVSGPVIAAAETLCNLAINQYSGCGGAQRLRIVSGPGLNTWPAGQMRQIDTVFVQFALSPRLGSRLKLTGFSMELGAHSLDNLKANVWYSTHPLLLSPVQVPYQTADTLNNCLPRNTTNTSQTVTGHPDLWLEPGETFYLRIYPWVDQNSSATSGKYLTIRNVTISGVAEGRVGFELATVTTQEVTSISTTSAAAGGLISADGGAPVVARGLCWSTTAAPTI
jgi:hypothetical protein